MTITTNECCDCATPAYPCMGEDCPRRHTEHLVCNKCGEEAEQLYIVDGEELCETCLLAGFAKVTLS